ncbi:MAG: methyltransferase domain-containing protein [Gammaproteobacteria bacterium]
MSLFDRFKRRHFHRCAPSPAEIWSDLEAWYHTPMGQRLQQLEQQALELVLPNLFGYHLVQIGAIGPADLTASSRISHRVTMAACRPSRSNPTVQFCGASDRLPIASDSVDVVLLPHVLEFSRHPHEVLREVERILVAEGHVVMLSFNPFSLWGAWRLLATWNQQLPWCGHFLSSTRLRDWLALLGFETVQQHGYGFMPPWNTSHLARRLHWLEQPGQRFVPFAAGSSLVVAKKRVITLTPIRPRWHKRQQPRWVTGGLVEPYTGAKRQRKVS